MTYILKRKNTIQCEDSPKSKRVHQPERVEDKEWVDYEWEEVINCDVIADAIKSGLTSGRTRKERIDAALCDEVVHPVIDAVVSFYVKGLDCITRMTGFSGTLYDAIVEGIEYAGFDCEEFQVKGAERVLREKLLGSIKHVRTSVEEILEDWDSEDAEEEEEEEEE